MASAINGLFGSPANPSGTTTTTAATTGAAPNEQMFLQLLVAQMKNQDPTNPVDATQFTSQLAQFSQLEQLVAIRGDLDSQTAALTGTGPANGTPTGTAAGTTPGTGGSASGTNAAGGSSSSTPTGSTTTQN